MSYNDGTYRPFAPYKVLIKFNGNGSVAFLILGRDLDSVMLKAFEEIKKFDPTNSRRSISITEIPLDINDGQDVKIVWVETTLPNGQVKME